MNYIAHYEPLSILNEINRIIGQSFPQGVAKADSSNIESSHWIPAVDIKEEKNRFVIFADLPGVEKKDINISMENNLLTLKGIRHTETSTEEKSKYFRTERAKGSFYRQFALPDTADDSKIEAKIQKGILEIIIPKKEAATLRSIEIQE